MRKLLLFAILFLYVPPAFAQAASSFAWDYAGVTAAQAQAFPHTVTVDGVAVTVPVGCIPALAVVTCQVPIGVLSAGSHTFVVKAVQGGVEKSTTAVIDPSKGPPNLGSPRVIVNVTVTFP